MIVLRIVFFAQLLVMLSGFTIFLVTPADFHTLALIFYLVIIAAAAILFAAWQFVRHRDRRGWAIATAATPLLCLTTPFLIVWLNRGPIPLAKLIATVIALIVIAFLCCSRKQLNGRPGAFSRTSALTLAFSWRSAYCSPFTGCRSSVGLTTRKPGHCQATLASAIRYFGSSASISCRLRGRRCSCHSLHCSSHRLDWRVIQVGGSYMAGNSWWR